MTAVGPATRVHWVDALFARLVLSREPRYFEDGWGPSALLDELARPPRAAAPPSLGDVALGPPARDGRLCVQEGQCTSPAIGPALPQACWTMRFQLLLPSGAGPRPPMCVLLAGSGDQAYSLRRPLGAALARHGVGTLLPEQPYCGRRRPPAQRGAAVRTVADLLLMLRAASLEAIALSRWLLARGHDKVCLSGYSLGGSLAAHAAAQSVLPLAVVPVAAAHALDAVFREGVLQEMADWGALGSGGGLGEARRRLLEVLGAASITALPPLADPRRAILLHAAEDGFVPPSSTLRLAEHWRGAELRPLRGGHVSAFFTGRRATARAILDALARL
ncbi:alpha/beta hydrolase family protein [Sorangium sp. So ce269]